MSVLKSSRFPARRRRSFGGTPSLSSSTRLISDTAKQPSSSVAISWRTNVRPLRELTRIFFIFLHAFSQLDFDDGLFSFFRLRTIRTLGIRTVQLYRSTEIMMEGPSLGNYLQRDLAVSRRRNEPPPYRPVAARARVLQRSPVHSDAAPATPRP